MPEQVPPLVAERRRSQAEPPMAQAEPVLTSAALEEALGQTLREALDLDEWDDRPGLQDLLERVPQAIKKSVSAEQRIQEGIRARILNELRQGEDAPAGAGVYQVDERHSRAARRNILLTGRLTASDGASTGHDGLAATIVAVGVCLTRYDGAMHSWRTTFLRHDYSAGQEESIEGLRHQR